MSKQKSSRQARERVAEMRAAELRRERTRRIAGGLVVSAAGAALIGGLVYMVAQQDDDDSGGDRRTTTADGVRSFTGLSQKHVSGKVNYKQTPPVGGDHDKAWQNCGIYTEPVENENAVHSLEHGAVWITYKKDLADAQVQALQSLVRGKPYLLLSPHPDVTDNAVASAWGKQLVVTDVNDPKLTKFISDFAQSPKAPEPGAPCTNGVGEPVG